MRFKPQVDLEAAQELVQLVLKGNALSPNGLDLALWIAGGVNAHFAETNTVFVMSEEPIDTLASELNIMQDINSNQFYELLLSLAKKVICRS